MGLNPAKSLCVPSVEICCKKNSVLWKVDNDIPSNDFSFSPDKRGLDFFWLVGFFSGWGAEGQVGPWAGNTGFCYPEIQKKYRGETCKLSFFML